MNIDLNSDKVSIRGPSVDGGFKVTFVELLILCDVYGIHG